jgi:reprolysin-like metallo-peptidase family M12B
MVSGTAVSTAGLTEWQVISHEMGHNFGAIVRPFRLDTDVFSDKARTATDPLA